MSKPKPEPVVNPNHDKADPEATHMFRGATGGALCGSHTGGISTLWANVSCTACRQIDMVSS